MQKAIDEDKSTPYFAQRSLSAISSRKCVYFPGMHLVRQRRIQQAVSFSIEYTLTTAICSLFGSSVLKQRSFEFFVVSFLGSLPVVPDGFLKGKGDYDIMQPTYQRKVMKV